MGNIQPYQDKDTLLEVKQGKRPVVQQLGDAEIYLSLSKTASTLKIKIFLPILPPLYKHFLWIYERNPKDLRNIPSGLPC